MLFWNNKIKCTNTLIYIQLINQSVVPPFLYANVAFLHPSSAHKMLLLLLLQDIADRDLQKEQIFHDQADLFAESDE